VIEVDLLIVSAGELLTCPGPTAGVRQPSVADLGMIHDGAIAIDRGQIVAVGRAGEVTDRFAARSTVDAGGRLVTPGLVDPHTHLVHGGSRHEEWERKVTGESLTGLVTGIASTRAATRATPSEDLHADAMRNLNIALLHGTTTLEAKSGYGLTVAEELRLLDVMHQLRHPIEVSTTFLGAHVVPAEFADRRGDYVQLVIDMLPDVRADWFDVWCDPMAFTPAESRQLLTAATARGFSCRVHADQTGGVGGTGLAVEFGAASVDHLDDVSDADLVALGASDTVAVLLPGCTLHQFETTVRDWRGWSRRIIESNAVVALSTDFNPGTCPMLSLPVIMGLASRLYRMSAAEIWLGVTLNAAASLRRADRVGSLVVGHQADVVIWNVTDHRQILNRFGYNLVDQVIKAGQPVVRGGIRI
jgi:imidazolonepropionase